MQYLELCFMTQISRMFPVSSVHLMRVTSYHVGVSIAS